MKMSLIVLGGLSVLGGLVMSGYTLANMPYELGDVNVTYGIIALAYLLGGVAGGIIPWGIADVIGRLEQLEAKR